MSEGCVVPREVSRRAEALIATGAPASVIRGVELLLQQNVTGATSGPQFVDCSATVKKALGMLAHTPFDLLGVPLEAKSTDVRKAYKKMALKYHPDKNPKTTPLFQLVQAANGRLASTPERVKEVQLINQRRAAVDRSRDAAHGGGSNTNQPANSGPAHRGSDPMQPSNGYRSDPSRPDQSKPAEANVRSEEQRRKNYYEDLLREQYRKAAESDRRAQEFAAKRAAEQSSTAPRAQSRPADGATTTGGAVPSASNANAADAPIKPASQPHSGAGSTTSAAPSAVPSAAPSAAPNAAPNAAPSAAKPKPRVVVPRPFAMRFSAVGSTMVEIEWKVSVIHPTPLVVELSWRERGVMSNGVNLKPWEVSDKLIRSTCVRKKNLVAGVAYDFRVRAVEELPGGAQGSRSDWTDPLFIALAPDKAVPSQTETMNSYKSMHDMRNLGTTTTATADASGKTPFKRFDSKAKLGKGMERLNEDDEAATQASDQPQLRKQGSRSLSNSAREAWGGGDQSADGRAPSSKRPAVDKERDPLDDSIYGAKVEVEEDVDRDEADDTDASLGRTASDLPRRSSRASVKPPRKVQGLSKKPSKRTVKGAGKPKASRRFETTKEREKATDDYEADFVEDEVGDEEEADAPEEQEFVLRPPANGREAANRADGLRSLQVQQYRHVVRSEPFERSRVRGYLVPDTAVFVSAECGEWLRVRVHVSGSTCDVAVGSTLVAGPHGWCLRVDKSGGVVVPKAPISISVPAAASPSASFASPPGGRPPRDTPASHSSLRQSASSELGKSLRSIPRPYAANKQLDPVKQPLPTTQEDVETWMECFDDSGNPYYFNEESRESRWEPPEWIEEHDAASGITYYVHIQRIFGQLSLTSTWERPRRFARLVRSSS